MQAINIANWFIRQANKDVAADGGEYMTHLKLQKLLYYAQGCHLAIKKTPLFEEDIYNWAHGPVVPQVYSEFKKFGDKSIKNYGDIDVSAEENALLEEVYDLFGQYSAWKLRNMTHSERPWLNTSTNQIITKVIIQKFFEEEYLVG